MNRETEKEARAQSGAGPSIVDLRDRVPSMDDKSLATLHANALRLRDAGTSKQRVAVGDLLPVIEGELASRQEAKRAAVAAKTPRSRKAKAAE